MGRARRPGRIGWPRTCSRSAVVAGDKVAIDLPNRPEYLETFYAALVLGCVPVNVNYRYTADEVHYLVDDSDAKVVVHTADVADVVRHGGSSGSGEPLAATRCSRSVRPTSRRSRRPHRRRIRRAAPSGDDLVFIYTGGTTGMPKGVMWRNEDLYVGLWVQAHPRRPRAARPDRRRPRREARRDPPPGVAADARHRADDHARRRSRAAAPSC